MSFPEFLFAAGLFGCFYLFLRVRRSQQRSYLQAYEFHPAIRKKVQDKYPHLSPQQVETVFSGLRDYFLFCHQAKRKAVAMPSQVVDTAWHEFILFTRAYAGFSRRVMGRYLHHTPTEAMTTMTQAQKGIKRAWRLACAHENINPQSPGRLPLLFAIDRDLEIPDGFYYSLNCKDKSSPGYVDGYCAGHIGCSSGCYGDSGVESSSGSGSFDGGSNCGSGCGGGGCGGD